MKTINVNKSELLDILKKNRTTHKKDYEESMTEYRKEVIERLRHILQQAEEGGEIKTSIQMIEPFNQLNDYDLAIQMLEMDSSVVVELDQDEFRQYVNDEWTWKRNFASNTMTYLNK